MKLSEGLLILAVVAGLVGLAFFLRSSDKESPSKTPDAPGGKIIDFGYGVTLKM